MKRLLLVLLFMPAISPVAAETLSIAAAANLIYALEALNAEFQRTAPEARLTVVSGASGNLVAQIRSGAPFDVFLSADLEYPEKLIALGEADRESLTRFAVGRLVLWTTRGDLSLDDVAATVRDPRIRKIAVANLTTAPYGRAAKAALANLGAWGDAAPKLVVGENITQTAQFVETGNADVGFVALSLVLSPRLRQHGTWQEIDPGLYPAIEQGAVLTKTGATNPVARRYLSFLVSPEARAVLERFGYRTPAATR